MNQKQPASRCLEVPRRRVPSLEVTMAEVEGYHCLLCEQVQAVSDVLDSTEAASRIKQTGQAMLDSLRQCIDLIKNTKVMGHNKPGSLVAWQPQGIPKILEHDASNKEEEEAGETSAASETASLASSSEYFDADEPKCKVMPGSAAGVEARLIEGDHDDDASDIEEDEEFLEEDNLQSTMAQNQSVIMHVIKHMRIGVDITRISLPAFILEKRSLLDLYAEMLAHPDLLTAVVDPREPKDRMIALLKWYLSSFHSGKQGAVAKKPYNPILGETFHCYWDLPNDTTTPVDENSQKILDSGPVPYAKYNSVTFVAEQLSHHPPMSGFYCECPSKRMYLRGSFLAKTRFLGFSVRVTNVGAVHVFLLDYGEEYVVTSPNVYVRSLLTTPWPEFGGRCQIQCLQSGYTADMEFHCKPFYGGRKHRVNAEVHHTSEEKPVLKVEGEWNGVMFAHHPDGKQEVFLDTLNNPTIRKKLKKLAAQDPGESRKRWQHVTEALKHNDIEAAAEAKHMLEEKQRADARERLLLGIEWKQKFFHSEGDQWLYNHPLDSRLKQL